MTKYDWEFVKEGYVITEDLEITDDTSIEEIMANTVDCEEVCNRLTLQEERIKELESKLEQVTDKLQDVDLPIEFEQWLYTEIVEVSEHYDEEVLSKITNALLGDN